MKRKNGRRWYEMTVELVPERGHDSIHLTKGLPLSAGIAFHFTRDANGMSPVSSSASSFSVEPASPSQPLAIL